MVILVKLFGILIVFMGFFFLLKPEFLKQYIEFWKEKKRLQAGGILSILIGIVFLMADSQCRIAWLITLLGVWAIVKGVILLVVKQKKVNAYCDWWLKKDTGVVRLFGIAALAFGVLILYSV